ncbi:MAG: ABC transporter permease [Gemmataceae bacterium]
MNHAARYFRLFGAFARFSLAREMAFRGNFLIKITVEMLWIAILLVFYNTIFTKTSVVATWTESEYLFFLGCHVALGAVIETFFLENCSQFAELIRTGNLDFYLLKPIDEQFLVSCKSVDWSTVPAVILGSSLMGIALHQLGWTFDAGQVLLFLAMFACGVLMAYSFMLFLTSASIWLKRNQSLYELWWLFSSLMRYPRDVFTRSWAAPVAWVFTFILPVMLVVNVPASVMVRVLEPGFVGYTALSTVVLLIASRAFFRYALQRYRSASS